jgi:methyl coenzyme M reductase beta subunit
MEGQRAHIGSRFSEDATERLAAVLEAIDDGLHPIIGIRQAYLGEYRQAVDAFGDDLRALLAKPKTATTDAA